LPSEDASVPPYVPSDQARFWLGTLTESADAGFVGTDLRGVIITWNPGAERLFGYTPPEILGRPIGALIPTDKRAEEAASLARIRAGETSVRLETERLRKDGRRTPVSLTMSPVLNERGEAIGVSVIARDLKRTFLIDAELLRREAVLRSILDTVHEALIIIGENGLIRSFSATAERLFGYAPEEVTGRNVSVLMPEPLRGAQEAYMARYLQTGERHIIGVGRVVAGRRKDGSTFPMELSVSEIVLPGVRQFTVFIRDLTERQDRERRLVELRSELVHVSRLNDLGQMVSTLAHEVAQPLTSLINYLSGTRRLLAAGRPEAAGQALERAAEQASRATRIVQRLRDFVRKGETEKRAEDLRQTIEEAGALAMLGVAHKLALELRVSPDATRAVIDKVQIQQVLFNLIRNAAEAMADDPRGAVSIAVTRDGEMAEIGVADTGPGLSEEVRARLFQPFVTSKPNGMGVGLSVCRTIVEAHGGRIWASVAPSGGASFKFTVSLPAPSLEKADQRT
jgi:two-component system sensor kinase FixL